jgi:hypothetical protein
LGFVCDFFLNISLFISQWWPWLNFWNDVFFIQLFIIYTYIYIYTYNNIYYTLMYTFINFFLIGIYLSMFQIEFFTAFLWLVECSVIFVFLLLLFYINIKGVYNYIYTNTYIYIWLLFILLYLVLINHYNDNDNEYVLSFYGLLDNYYEALFNPIMNDLFGFSISYYLINAVEFLFIGFLLLLGSVVCVNLYQFNKNVSVQSYNSFLTIFNFFNDFSSFFFLRRQNLVKQGNTKATLKIYKKK